MVPKNMEQELRAKIEREITEKLKTEKLETEKEKWKRIENEKLENEKLLTAKLATRTEKEITLDKLKGKLAILQASILICIDFKQKKIWLKEKIKIEIEILTLEKKIHAEKNGKTPTAKSTRVDAICKAIEEMKTFSVKDLTEKVEMLYEKEHIGKGKNLMNARLLEIILPFATHFKILTFSGEKYSYIIPVIPVIPVT